MIFKRTLSLLSLCALAGACSESQPKPAPTVGDGRVTINSNGDELSDSLEVKDQPVDVQAAGRPNARVYVPDSKYALTLVAEVAPPQIDGNDLQATSVAFDGERAVVSYNTASAVQQGAVDVFVFDKDRQPRLTSRATFSDTDVHAVAASAGRVWLATATADESFGTPAVLERLTLSSEGLLTLDEHLRVGLSSYAATSVTVAAGRIFATSGNTGGVFAIDPVTGRSMASASLDDARWVAAPGDGTAVTVQGTPGRLAQLDGFDLSLIDEYAFDGANIPESKSTVQVLGGKAFIAGGPGGVHVIDLATGTRIAHIPVPSGLPLLLSEVVSNAVSVDGDLIFISNGSAGVYLVSADASLATPYDPKVGSPALTEVGRLLFEGDIASVNHIAYKDGFLFVATGRGGLKIVRVDRIAGPVTPPSGFPYVTDFADEGARSVWTMSGDWGWGSPDGERHGVSGVFLDNNPRAADQNGISSAYAELGLPLAIPSTGSPTLSFSYRAAFLDKSDEVAVQIARNGGNDWKSVATFTSQSQRADTARRLIALDEYAGKSIRVRLRQKMGDVAGARVFTADDFAVAPFVLPALAYPFETSFESDLDRSRWNLEGRWGWSSDEAFDGRMNLDANPGGAAFADHVDGQTAELLGLIPVPASGNPIVGLWYRSALSDDDSVTLQVQVDGQSKWDEVVTFKRQSDSREFAYREASLASWSGKSVRVRLSFAFKSYAARTFVIDSLRVGPLVSGTLPFPYANGFEGPVAAGEWVSEGVLGVGSLADGGSGIVSDAAAGGNTQGQVHTRDRVPLPATGTALVSFRAKMTLIGDDALVLESQATGADSWKAVASYGASQTHPAWSAYEVPLQELLGQSVRLRFRAAFGATVGEREVVIDDVAVSSLPTARFAYPYLATLDEGSLSSWVVNGSWTPRDGLIDGNPQGRSQAGWATGQVVAMPGYVLVPSRGRPTLLVSLDFAFSDANDKIVLELQSADSATWTALRTYTSTMNRLGFGWDELPLEAYANKSVRMRVRYELGTSTAPRRMRLGDIRIEDLAPAQLSYPWANDLSSVDQIAQWTLWGAWAVGSGGGSSQAASGTSFLDGNPGGVAQNGWSTLQTATMAGSVIVPSNEVTWLGLRHHFGAVHHDDALRVEVQPSDSSAWTTVATLDTRHLRPGYSALELPLDAWRGRSLRVRFAMTLGASDVVREIAVDDVWVGPLSLPDVAAPVTTDFTQGAASWSLSGLWSASSAGVSYNSQQLDDGGYATFQTATFGSFVDLAGVKDPRLSLAYTLTLIDSADRAYVETLSAGASEWKQVAELKKGDNTASALQKTWSLSKNDTVRVRVRVVSAATPGARSFVLKSITIGSEK